MISKVDADAEWLAFGPAGDRLPSGWWSDVDYSRAEITVRLRCIYSGAGRVQVPIVEVTAKEDRSIAPYDLTTLEMAAVVREASGAMVDPGHGLRVDKRPGRRPTPDELYLLAAVYWAEYVTWGSPRQAVMGYWSLPRSTANGWIRRARELYAMPGDGTGGERGEHPEAG